MKVGKRITRNTRLLSYGIALSSVALAMGIGLLLGPVIQPTPTSLFFIAVMVSARYGGLGPGLVTTVLSTLAINYCFVPPYYTLDIITPGSLLRLGLFVMAALLIGGWNWIASVIDITDRKQVEEALRQSEEQLRLASESAKLGLWHWDVEHDILTWTDQCKALFGLPADTKMSYQVFLDALHPEDRQRIQEMRPLLEDGQLERHENEYRTVWPDGTVRWLAARGSAIYDANRKPISSMGVVFDITDRKQAEMALSQSEARFRRIFECNMVPMGIWSRSGGILHANDALLNLIGYTPKELEAGQINWQTLTPPEWLPLDERSLAEIATQGFSTPFEKEYLHKQGHRVPILIGGASFLDDPDSGIFFAVDLTEGKRTEAALRQSETILNAFIASSPVGMAFLDCDWRYVYANEALAAINGIPLNEHLGRTLEEVLPQWAPMIKPIFQQVMQTQAPLLNQEVVGATHPADRVRHGLVNYFPICLPDGEVIGVGVTSLDITDRKQTEMALVAQEQRYRYIFEAVGVSIWEEDFSEVKAAIDQLKAIGVEDFRHYFAEHPEFVQQALDRVYLRDVNQSTLQLFGAQNKVDLLNSLHQIFTPQTQEAFIGELLTIAAEKTSFAAETVLQTLQGDRLHVWFTITFPPPSEPYDRVLVSLLDITDRKQAEEALRRSEERLRISQELSLDAFTILDSVRDETGAIVDFVWTYVNPKAAEILQRPVEELVGQRLLEVLPGNQLNSELFQRYVQVVETGEPHDIELSYNADGITGWFRNMAVRLEDGIAIFFNDITERKQTEQALGQAEERLRVALQNAPITVFNQDRELKYTWIHNPVLHDLHEMLGKCDRDFLPPEDAEPLTTIKQQVLETGIGVREEIKITRDRTYYYDLTVEPLRDANNTIVGITCAAIDISELKQTAIALRESEERLRLATEAADIYSWELDLKTQTATVSDNFAAVVGCQSHDFPMNTDNTMIEFVHPEDLSLLSAAVAKAIEADDKLRLEYRFLNPKTGAILWVESIGSVLRDRNGTPVQMIGITQNVSDRKRAEAEREQLLAREQVAREAAEAANRIKDEFLAVVSHELRSPLNPILGWSKLLRTHQLDEQKTDRALEVIERNAQIQAQLINDLLDVSRILRGKLSLDARPVDLVATIQAAMETVRLAAEAKSIQIHTQFEPKIGQVSGDAGRLQQVIWNLLSNAVKFTSEGGRVDIRLERIDSQVQIIVTDTGKGIPSDFLPYVFDRFRQESSATTRRFGGLGLGLAIVRYLVELHGGTVQADSLGEGQGATFTVKLPLMPHQPTTNPDTKPSESSLDLQGIRILVVDDDDNTREFLAFLLELHGANVIATATASEAIATLTQFKPDVLLSDIGMPDVDGYMLMRQIRTLLPKQGGTIPAIALTAYAGEIDYQQAMAAGFQQHVPKPVEPEVLVGAIATLLGQATPTKL